MIHATQASFDARVGLEPARAPAGNRSSASQTATATVGPRITIHDDLAAAEADWRAFEQNADCTVFQSFGWLSAWMRQVGKLTRAQPLIVVVRDAGGAIQLLLPLAIESRALARRLTFLGSDLCDYNAPLLAKDFTGRGGGTQFAQLWRDIVERLHSHPRWGYDLIDFQKMPPMVGAQPNPMLGLGVSVHPSRAYQTKLSGDWNAYYDEKRSSSTRRRDRTKRNRLGDFGAVRFVHAQSDSDVRRSLATLMAQKSRWFAKTGAANIFRRPGYPEFYGDFATASATRQIAHVSRLDIGEEPSACNFGLIFRGCYYHILASHTDGEAERFGPGVAHLHDLLRYAIGQGCHTFDFTIGDERYKRDWCETETPLYNHLAVTSLRGAVAALPITVVRRLKDWVKRHPACLDWAVKGRALLGKLKP